MNKTRQEVSGTPRPAPGAAAETIAVVVSGGPDHSEDARITAAIDAGFCPDCGCDEFHIAPGGTSLMTCRHCGAAFMKAFLENG